MHVESERRAVRLRHCACLTTKIKGGKVDEKEVFLVSICGKDKTAVDDIIIVRSLIITIIIITMIVIVI